MNKPTPEQKVFIEADDRVISFWGPAGSGKSETLGGKMVHECSNDPDVHILCVSLTRLAVDSLRTNLPELKGWNDSLWRRIEIGTFHKLAYRYVRQYAQQLGYFPNFEIDAGITKKLLRELLKRKEYRPLRKSLKLLLDVNQRHIRSGKKLRKFVNLKFKSKYQAMVKSLLQKLKRLKVEGNVMDFDDLLFHFHWLLRTDKRVFHSVLLRYTHLIVDEFQDTTGMQWRISKLLIAGGIRFIGAGDPYQTIHLYAGASLKRFDQLEALGGCKKCELTQNHRSTQQIVSLSNAILGQYNDVEFSKVRTGMTGPLPKVYLNEYAGQLHMAILKLINKYHKKGLSLNDMAVVARFDKDLANFAPVLVKSKVPYIFHKKQYNEIPVAIRMYKAIVKISLDGGSRDPWSTVLPYLSGIGKRCTKSLLNLLKDDKYNYRALHQYSGQHNKPELEKLLRLIDEIRNHRKDFEMINSKIMTFLKGLKKRIRSLDLYAQAISNLASLSPAKEDLMFSLYELSDINFSGGVDRSGNAARITLANIHQIKGGQFKAIFLLGSFDSRFKAHDTFKKRRAILEELYVLNTAITRTEKHLWLFFPISKDDWLKIEDRPNPSRFVRNCSPDLLRFYKVKQDTPKP